MSFLTALAQKGVIPEDGVNALQQEAEQSGKSLEQLLREKGVNPSDILEAKGMYYGLPTRQVAGVDVPIEILNYVPEESARYYHFVPLGIVDGALEVGVTDPDNIEAKDALQFISTKHNLPFKLFLISEEDFERIVESYKGLSGQVTQALSDLETELSGDEEELSRRFEEVSDETNVSPRTGTEIVEDAPVTKIVATVLKHAIESNASDIHIEPAGEKLRIRFRVDGILTTSLILPMKVHSAIVARIKILSTMKLDEKRKPQDNRFSARISGRKVDFRVSTFPTYYGEKIVIRILDSEKGVLPLDAMGLSEKNLNAIREAIKRPYGLVLISGPTGSGKTTTLYSMLEEVDRETKNVLSLEDPVEYNIEGMNQSQVRPEIGYTFASGLRTTLRQDPDIIMVGEIRDKETAGLAIQAALTGHLVLSTIHTNNAAGVIPRLIDMEVDPYLIAPTLILAMAQRLTKKLPPEGGLKTPVEGSIKKLIERQFEDLPQEFRKDLPPFESVHKLHPTDAYPKGTQGRMAVFEILEMDKEVEQVILADPTELKLMETARKKGFITMKEDALIKSTQGLVPFEEVNTLGGIYDSVEEESVPPPQTVVPTDSSGGVAIK